MKAQRSKFKLSTNLQPTKTSQSRKSYINGSTTINDTLSSRARRRTNARRGLAIFISIPKSTYCRWSCWNSQPAKVHNVTFHQKRRSRTLFSMITFLWSGTARPFSLGYRTLECHRSHSSRSSWETISSGCPREPEKALSTVWTICSYALWFEFGQCHSQRWEACWYSWLGICGLLPYLVWVCFGFLGSHGDGCRMESAFAWTFGCA